MKTQQLCHTQVIQDIGGLLCTHCTQRYGLCHCQICCDSTHTLLLLQLTVPYTAYPRQSRCANACACANIRYPHCLMMWYPAVIHTGFLQQWFSLEYDTVTHCTSADTCGKHSTVFWSFEEVGMQALSWSVLCQHVVQTAAQCCTRQDTTRLLVCAVCISLDIQYMMRMMICTGIGYVHYTVFQRTCQVCHVQGHIDHNWGLCHLTKSAWYNAVVHPTLASYMFHT